jgi:hypothetical protein
MDSLTWRQGRMKYSGRTFLSIFYNGLANLKAEKDEVEGQEDDLLSIFDNELAQLKAEKDEVWGQEDDLPVYTRQWNSPPEGREGWRRGTRRRLSCLYSKMDSPTWRQRRMKLREKETTFLSIFFYNGLAHLKAEKVEVEGQEDDLPVYILQWSRPHEGREGWSRGTRRRPSCLYSTMESPTWRQRRMK